MSEFHVVEVCFKDEDILVKSLQEMGYKPEVHKEATNLYGYQGDKRSQKAHIVIPRSQVGSASNDVGFEKSKGGFILHASEYDRPWRKDGAKLKKLNKIYAEKKLTKVVGSSANYNIFHRKEREDGKIEIHIRVRG